MMKVFMPISVVSHSPTVCFKPAEAWEGLENSLVYCPGIGWKVGQAIVVRGLPVPQQTQTTKGDRLRHKSDCPAGENVFRAGSYARAAGGSPHFKEPLDDSCARLGCVDWIHSSRR